MKYKIAIIGGGLAGLTSAYLFHEKFKSEQGVEFEVKLFEATDRIGGRVYTLNWEDGLYAEAGALSISSHEKAILNLAKELNVETTLRPDRSKGRCYEKGQWVTDSDFKKIMRYLMQKISELKEKNIITSEQSWLAQGDNYSQLHELDEISIIEFLQNAINENKLELTHPDNLLLSARSCLLGLYSDDLENLSAWDALRYLSQYHESKYGLSIKNGNEQLPMMQVVRQNCA